MGKKIKFGDPTWDLDSSIDILDDAVVQTLQEERKKMAKLYEAYEMKVPKVGLATVKYVGVVGGTLAFDGGFKDFVRIDNKPNESKYLVNTKIGESVDVYITEVDEENFLIQGSISELYESRAREILTTLEEGVSVTALVKEMTPAGYSVEIHFEGVTLPGFMPNTLAGINKLSHPESILHSKMEVMIESYSREEGTYIVSRRKYLQTLIPIAIKELQYGTVYDGRVTGTTPFGVFVEFNECLTGMIHKTNINPEWADRLQEISPGFNIQFYIKEIIKDKIILTQILRDTLWDSIKVGQIISGKVRDIKSFGALVSLDEETNGLIHTSELEKSSRKIGTGEEVKVKVIAVDRSARKIFLSVAN